MRIAFVAPFGMRAKGTTRARALPLAHALAARGNIVALFVPPYDSPEDSGKHWEQNGVAVFNMRLPDFGNGLGRLAYLVLAWRALLAVRNWKPDIVHVFKPKGPSGLVGGALWLLGARSRGAQRGTSLQRCSLSLVIDSDDWEGPGGWNDDPRAGYSRVERRFFAWQERYGLSHANAWTVASTCLYDRAVRFGADPARVFVLPNGVSWSAGHNSITAESTHGEDLRTASVIGHPPTAVLYTRFAGVRTEDVVAIWRRVQEVSPDACLTVVGRGLAGEEEALRNLPGISVLGWVEPEDLPATFAAADVAVVPWADTPSNRARHSAKVLELMVAGLPIVAYAVGELPATLGDAGVLVEPGDGAAYARAIVALFGDAERARRLGVAARARVLARYTWKELAEVAVEAYRTAGRYSEKTGESPGKPGEIGATHKTTSD
jgi:glycosyltransferase involved in cell wall biosynthesis